jgi:hypothetical protein
MNFLFLTQNKTLSIFFGVAKALADSGNLNDAGFYLSDSSYFDAFEKENAEISSERYETLKEWEIIEKSERIEPDLERLNYFEKQYGDPVLWNALVADRRIFLGENATLEQDYSARFSHKQMLAILQVTIEEMEALFEKVKPDVVICFICVTIGEYLGYLIAKSRNIQFINLRPTRIRNYFHGGESVLEPSKRLTESFQTFQESGLSSSLKADVTTYLETVRKTHAMYEGVTPASGTLDLNSQLRHFSPIGFIRQKARTLKNMARRFYLYNIGKYRKDNSHLGVFYPVWIRRIKNPYRQYTIKKTLKSLYYSKTDLLKIKYVFYPLHKEPEVTLLVYSRAYLNQIEVIRNIARSLPVGMKLVVKEHPTAVGYRPLSYYKKLLNIPGVVLVPPQMESRELVQNAKLVTIISGSVGLEALMLKKPVIHFGRIPFSILPGKMIRQVTDFEQLGREISYLLDNHVHDENTLMSYLAAVITSSVPVDFYSILLGRQGVYRPDAVENKGLERKKQVEKLADYLLQCSEYTRN